MSRRTARRQRFAAAAKDRRWAKTCRVGPAGHDHDWKLQDDSFDHEYGTHQAHSWHCANCDAFRDGRWDDFADDYDD